MGAKYYLTKIIYSFVLLPGNMIVLFLISALFAKKFRKFFIFSAIVFYLLSTQFVGNLLLRPLESPYNHPPQKADVDAVVVLGSGHYEGSSNLPLTPSGTKRLLYALMLAKKQNLPILFNGLGTEADVAEESAVALNDTLGLHLVIDHNSTYTRSFRIYFEKEAQNTRQNAARTKAFFDKNAITRPRIYLVTSAAHMRRARYLFEKEGITVIPAATDFRTNEAFCYCFFFPSSEGLDLSSRAILEYLAYLKDSR